MLSLGDGIAIASVLIAAMGVFLRMVQKKSNGHTSVCPYHSGFDQRLAKVEEWLKDLEVKLDTIKDALTDIKVNIAEIRRRD